MPVVLCRVFPSAHIPKEPTLLLSSVRWCCNRVQGSDFVSKDQVCRDRVCTKHLSRMKRSWKSALGFREPASRKSSVPVCRPDQDSGFVVGDQSQLLRGLGTGQNTETVVVAPPYKGIGARGCVQSSARDSGYLPMVPWAFKDAVGLTLSAAPG